MLPATPSGMRVVQQAPYGRATVRRNWRVAADEIAFFLLLANLLWALVILVVMVFW